MSNQPKTFSAYVMFCGSNEVPEQSGLTRSECINSLMSACKEHPIDLILHIESGNFPWEWETGDVTKDIFDEAYNHLSDANDNEPLSSDDFQGRMADMVEEEIESGACHIAAMEHKADERAGR